ncbi:MAG: hypothetical protein ACOCRX_01700 [Candidatus Woesearchaeota archaeon]
MSKHVNFLNNKEKRELLNKIYYHWEVDLSKFFKDLIVNLSDKNRIYLIKRDVMKLDLNFKLKGSLGLYFGTIESDGIRLSTQGAQYLKKTPYKLDLGKNLAKKYFNKEKINVSHLKYKQNPYLILTCDDLILSCDKVKKGEIINYLNKTMYGTTLF